MNREELLAKAANLGLDFPKNIPTDKLATQVEKALEEATQPPKVQEAAPTQPPVEMKQDPDLPSPSDRIGVLELRRRKIQEARERAFATKVVTVTNKDNRENDVMTTAYVSFENQHFGLSKLVPLDVPVELEQGLIDVLEATTMTLHKDEIIDGKRTGNRIATTVKKFSISYNQNQPE